MNQLRNFDVGNNSSWVVKFLPTPSGPDVSKLNLIANTYAPVSDINYTQLEVISEDIDSELLLKLPVYVIDSPRTISLTMYDDHNMTINKELIRWMKTINPDGRLVPLSELYNYCAKLSITKNNKQGDKISHDVFYVYLDGDLGFQGDQSFSTYSFPVTFQVLGRV
jgi:hypothetical protein